MALEFNDYQTDKVEVSGPPHIMETLTRVISEMREHCAKNRIRWPAMIPSNPAQAASWWIEMQEPPVDGWDNPRQVNVIGRDAFRWECPYHLRLAANFRTFLGLSEMEQSVVIAAVEDGVYWRGEPVAPGGKPGAFIKVVDEIARMKDMGLAAYREEVKKKLEAIL